MSDNWWSLSRAGHVLTSHFKRTWLAPPDPDTFPKIPDLNVGHRALNGGSAFTLTTQVLEQLNFECRRHSISINKENGTSNVTESNPSNSPPLTNKPKIKQLPQSKDVTEWNYHVQFIKDFMEFAPNLKLIACGVMTSTISLYRFANLSSINLQKVSIHLIVGLHVMRATLTSITIYKSLEKLKDLLEFCGGDKSNPLAWTQLKTASFTFNSLSQLDDSLRLLPHMEAIDLSHNSLENCDSFLEYLGDIRSISLAYNLLSQVQSVAISARASLTCLIMRGNNLDNLKGLQVLVSLQQLDLGENCISKHSDLDPLTSLIHLKQLQLDGNPVFYHRLHRQLSAASLAIQAATAQFELDKKMLTTSEISYFRQVKAQFDRMAVSHLQQQKGVPVRRKSTGDRQDSLTTVSDGVTEHNSTEMPSPKLRRLNKPKRLKARHMPIIDRNNEGDIYYSQEFRPGSAPHARNLEKLWNDRREEALKTKRDVEELRREYGPNWLQAIEDRDIFNRKKTTQTTMKTSLSETEKTDVEKHESSQVVVKSIRSHESAVKKRISSRVSDTESETKERSSEGIIQPTSNPKSDVNTMISVCDTSVRVNESSRQAIEASMGVGEINKDISEANMETTEVNMETTEVNMETTEVNMETTEVNMETTEVNMEIKDVNVSASEDSQIETRKTNILPKVEQLDSTDSAINYSAKPVMSTIARLVAGLLVDIPGEDGQYSYKDVPSNKATIRSIDSLYLTDNVTDKNVSEVKVNSNKSLAQNVTEGKETKLVHKTGQKISPTPLPVSQDGSPSRLPDQTFARHKHGVSAQQNDMLTTLNTASGSNKTNSERSAAYDTHRSHQVHEKKNNMDNFPSSSEEDEVCEPMFVTCPLRENQMIILSISASFLVEKDIRGQMTEKLELASLTHMEWKIVKQDNIDEDKVERTNMKLDGKSWTSQDNEEIVSEDDRKKMVEGEVDECWQFDLKFDYMRKDKQNRRYLIDAVDGKVIVDHLQPFLDLREDQAKIESSANIQCLKCNQIFEKGDLLQPGQTIPKSKSYKDVQQSTGQDTQSCPRCGSCLIIELTPSTITSQSSVSSVTRTSVQSNMTRRKRLSNFIKRSVPGGSHTVEQQTTDKVNRSTKVQSKKMSTSVPPVSAGSQVIIPKSQGGAYGSGTMDIQATLSNLGAARDRSSAFRLPEKMSISSLTASFERREENEDQLICVEDHFSVNAMSDIVSSSQLAKMTTTLQGHFSDRDKSRGERSSSFTPTRPTSTNHIKSNQQNVRPSSDDPCPPVVDRYHNKNIATEVNFFNKINDSNLKQQEEITSVGTTTTTATTTTTHVLNTSRHTSLAAMTDIVNLLVNEGKNLSEQEIDISQTPTRDRSIVSVPDINNTSRYQKDIAGSLQMNQTNTNSRTYMTSDQDHSSDFTQDAHTSSVQATSLSIGTTARSDALVSSNSETIKATINRSLIGKAFADVTQTDDHVLLLARHTVASLNSAGISESPSTVTSDEQSTHTLPENVTSIYDDHGHVKTLPAKKLVHSDRALPADILATSKINLSCAKDDAARSHSSPAEVEAVPGSDKDYRSVILTKSDDVVTSTNSADVAEEEEEEMSDDNIDQDDVGNDNYHRLNHRLTLYMMMSLFAPDEEVVCKIQCPVVQYIIEEAYQAILVMSTMRFYILKIISQDRSRSPEHWLQCVEIQPIPELHYIDVGLGGQTFRLEFVTDCSSFTLITQNKNKTAQFVDLLHTNLANYAVRHCLSSHVIVNEDIDQVTMNNLDKDVVLKTTSDRKLLFYCMGYIEKGVEKHVPVSFAITTSDICLVRSNHQWPQPRLQAPITVETVGQQFTVLDRQKVNNVAAMEVCNVTMRKIRLELFSETEGISTSWKITLGSRQSTGDFIRAISEPWSQDFGVEMNITYAQLDF